MRSAGGAWTQDPRHARRGCASTRPPAVLCDPFGVKTPLCTAKRLDNEAAGRNRYVFLNGRLQRLPHNFLSFVTSGVLSWRAKCRLLTERFRRPRPDAGDESIDAFARRRLGDEIADNLADALVTGIYAG